MKTRRLQRDDFGSLSFRCCNTAFEQDVDCQSCGIAGVYSTFDQAFYSVEMRDLVCLLVLAQ